MKKKKLNKNAQAWVKALRSGKYKQGKGLLKPSRGGYCCLGVACEVYKKVTGKGLPEYGNIGQLTDGFDVVRKWLNLSDGEGAFYTGPSLVDINDETRSSFSEIADIIESNPKGLFVRGR